MFKKILGLVLLVALLGCAPAEQKADDCMGVKFDGTTNGQKVDYGAKFDSLAQKSFITWYDITDLSGTTTVEIFGKFHTSPLSGWGLFVDKNVDALVFFQYWSSAAGGLVTWTTPTNSLTTGKHFIGVSYDRSSAANDPIIMIDGVSQSLTENTAPAGSPTEDATDSFILGAYRTDRAALGGTMYTGLLYNRALTVSEFQSAYNSRLAVPSRRGLVFAPNLCKAKSVSVFDGTVLGATNTIVDEVNGYTGTPGGSPVGKGDDLLVHAGEN